MYVQEQSSQLVSFLLSLVKNSPYGILTIDTRGTITMANTLAARHIGFSLEDALDGQLLDIIPHLPELVEKIEDALQSGKTCFELPRYPINDTFVTFKANEMNDGMLLTTEDITDIVESEAEQHRLNEVLLANNKQLEQYTYIVSHNLRAPVANIMGLSDILASGAVDEEIRSSVMENIQISARNLNEILADLNEIIATKTQLSEIKQTLNFEHELQIVTNSITQQIEESCAIIHADFKNAPQVLSVKSYLHSILHNLMTNAIKYRKQDEPLIVKLTTSKTEDSVVLSFADNGLGIDMQKHGNKIFGLYKRFHHTVEGRGLGLHLVKTQIEAMGGSISVMSTPNVGTEFTITLDQ